MTDKRIDDLHEMALNFRDSGAMSEEQYQALSGILDEKRESASRLIMTPERIKRIREQQHLSQSQLAKVMYMSPSSIQKWERGAIIPQGPALRMLEVIEEKGIGFFAE